MTDSPIPPADEPASTDARPLAPAPAPDPADIRKYLLYTLSLPERALRSTSAVVAGAVRESASLLVPQAFQNSKTYSVMVLQMLDFMADDVGGVQRRDSPDAAAKVENFVARKTVGNFVDMAGLVSMHLSPLLVLAAVSDIAYGSQAYLRELTEELKRQGIIDSQSTIHHVDDLLSAVGRSSGVTASAFDTPPLSVEGLRDTIVQTRAALGSIDPRKIIPQAEIATLWEEIRRVAAHEGVSPWAVSTAMTLYAISKVATVGRGALSGARVAGNLFERHVVDHYVESLADIRRRGLYAALRATSGPYIEAVWCNFSGDKATITEDVLGGKLLGKARGAVRKWLGHAPKPPNAEPRDEATPDKP
jgi:hypothetical protein